MNSTNNFKKIINFKVVSPIISSFGSCNSPNSSGNSSRLSQKRNSKETSFLKPPIEEWNRSSSAHPSSFRTSKFSQEDKFGVLRNSKHKKSFRTFRLSIYQKQRLVGKFCVKAIDQMSSEQATTKIFHLSILPSLNSILSNPLRSSYLIIPVWLISSYRNWLPQETYHPICSEAILTQEASFENLQPNLY